MAKVCVAHLSPPMNHKNKHSPPLPSDRSFGLLFVAVFTLLSVWAWWTGSAWAVWSAALGALTLLITLVRPALLNPLNRQWMRLAELLNRVVSPVVLGLIYFGLFTPTAWGMRLRGRDALRLHLEPDAATYWIERDPPGPDPTSLPNQY